ncbi:ATP-binding protein [Haliangium ochraceum]|uniref:histidine kinase n=1 Tax=Haliangium ochraceum (strain DSM 14365 / JCM 11303 / SMP-2) TaxID=502025 RepID=D0LWF6_HALO1|nr:ATP-binding protein [Haliangium ochraceum]ACY17606.1 integral membrane sensor hybrid histidine kinase [Haliangium ochraceum DSM 14365]
MFSTNLFMPHGHCYLWQPGLLFAQVVSNALIGLSYVAISLTLLYLVRRGDYLPFKGMALAFGTFIISCGLTHFMDIYVIWYPSYWLDSAVRGVTAIASVATALILPSLVPRAVALARGARMARARGIELEAAVDDLAQLYTKTRELEQLKTEFFANVSHDLRTPLTLIMGPLQKLAQAENLLAGQRQDIEVALRSANTLLGRMNDILDVARLDAGELSPSYASCELDALVREAASHFDVMAGEREIDLSIEAEETLVAELDPSSIQRVLLNLMANAFEHTPRGGRIRCSLERISGERVRIEVADSGPGVPPDKRSQIFQRFQRGEAQGERRFDSSSGLGLAICKDFVLLHRGRIVVLEAPEGGALFRIELPRRAPEGAEVAARVEPPTQSQSGAAALSRQAPEPELEPSSGEGNAVNKPVVLVIEDNVDMNRFVVETLAEGYHTVSALDGREGLDLALNHSPTPSLIISDLMMPEMNGERLITELRNHAQLDDVPVLFLSARDEEALRTRLLRSGAQDYLAKPFSPGELRARADNLVRVKRTCEVLQRALDSQSRDLEQLARELAQRKRALQDALESTRVAREQAEQASQLKSDFLGMVTHELRSPLASLALQLERLDMMDANPAPAVHTLRQRMNSSIGRLSSLIESLLEYVRVQRGHLEVRPERFDLHLLVTDLVDDLKIQAEDKRLELSLRCEGRLPQLLSDMRLVRLAVLNLVGNAIKFTDEGSIAVALSYADERHLIAVSDTGPGIPDEAQHRIFQPFEQMVTTRKKHLPGVGLGLALVREMVTSVNGTIALESKVGVGSTFRIALPPFVVPEAEPGADDPEPGADDTDSRA